MIAVGKIHDIFAGRGLTEFVYTTGNTDGLAKTMAYADKEFTGLCFVNLVDFDMLYGHRRDPDGYARALHEFVRGCRTSSPSSVRTTWSSSLPTTAVTPPISNTPTTHANISRWSPSENRSGRSTSGTRPGFCDIAATVAELLDVPYETPGRSFAHEIV